jgi:hypothetical protein
MAITPGSALPARPGVAVLGAYPNVTCAWIKVLEQQRAIDAEHRGQPIKLRAIRSHSPGFNSGDIGDR